MRVTTLLVAASVLLSSAAGRAESSAINLHFNPTLVLPQVGGGLTAGADWQFRRGRTPRGAKVDERGCTVVPKQIVLRGIRFKFDSADIEPESTTQLEEVAIGLKDNPKVRVEISGHSDDQGDPGYNQRLSERRAEAVAAWLSQHGVNRARIVTRGYGKTRPLAPNDSDEHRALNRRIEFCASTTERFGMVCAQRQFG